MYGDMSGANGQRCVPFTKCYLMSQNFDLSNGVLGLHILTIIERGVLKISIIIVNLAPSLLNQFLQRSAEWASSA